MKFVGVVFVFCVGVVELFRNSKCVIVKLECVGVGY